MPHFICPNCGNRSLSSERTAGFRREARGCQNCGFGFLFELLDDYYPAPDAAFFVCDAEARIIGLGRGSRELTGLNEERVIGRPAREVLGLAWENGEDDLAQIVTRSAQILGVALQPGGAMAIAGRSRGTPRVANRLLKRVRDYAEVHGDGRVTAPVAAAALDLLEVDGAGLDRLDRELLRALCEKFAGGPVGLSTLAVAVGEEADTVEDVYEPYLLQRGFVKRTPRGRVATARAFEHLGVERPAGAASLF